ncbi:MAG: GNAT family N-acetyltransferase [Novosphingobium sp.]|nr:GNAT family N-acetyltransferase [Novosphingobium sp.]
MIETERLRLRPPRADDGEWWLATLNTPEVNRFLGGPRDPATVAAQWARNVATFGERGRGFRIAELRGTGEPLGQIGFSDVAEPLAPAVMRGRPQIGWKFAPAHWGRGLAGEAARALLQWGFAEADFETVWAQTSDSNAASTRLMARLGLTPCPKLSYRDPAYPAADNPTTVYRADLATWRP